MNKLDLINRRAFLQRSAALTAATALGSTLGQAAATTPDVKAIDTHTHFYDPKRPQGVPWPSPNEKTLYRTVLPSEFVELSAKHGVVGTVVVEASPWLEDNQWILDLAKDNPIIVGFVGNLAAGTPEFAGHLKRFGANPLFRGIRLNSGAVAKGLGQAAFEGDLKRLGDGGFSLDLLGGASMLPDAVRVAKLAPNLGIVIDHLPFKDWDRNPAAMLRGLNDVAACPNIHAKVSEVVRRMDGKVVEDAAFYRPGLDALWELFGPDRVIYGSNWPVSNLVAPYANVYQRVADYLRTKSRETAEKYFWRNSLAFYHWHSRGLAAGLLK